MEYDYNIRDYLILYFYELQQIKKYTNNLKFICFKQLLEELKPIEKDLKHTICLLDNNHTNLYYIKHFNRDFIISINQLEINQYTNNNSLRDIWYNIKELNQQLDIKINHLILSIENK